MTNDLRSGGNERNLFTIVGQVNGLKALSLLTNRLNFRSQHEFLSTDNLKPLFERRNLFRRPLLGLATVKFDLSFRSLKFELVQLVVHAFQRVAN